MPTFNADLPDGLVHKGMPVEAIVGHLNDDTTIETFADAMTTAGIDEARIHVLNGAEGAAVLNNIGSRLSRMFGPDRHAPIKLLNEGATLVGVFAVPDDEQAATASALTNAGVTVLHRFGKWTYS